MFKVVAILFYIWLLIFVGPSVCDNNDSQILIDLKNVQPGETITQFHNITNAEFTTINVTHIQNTIRFFIIQVHTFLENVTLSYKYPLDTHSYTKGTNIGLVWNRDVAKNLLIKDYSVAAFYLLRPSQFHKDLNMLLVISTYSKYDPVPGGCNLSFETELAPYQKINQTDAMIIVISQPPSLFGLFCDKSNITTESYYLYLNEYDNTTDEYFLGIQRMLTLENITKYGTKVPNRLTYKKYQGMYNRYSGTGRVFSIVSTYEGRSSVYVPATSYGCNLNAWEEDCFGPAGSHWKLVIALLLICGIFICLTGHRFFTSGLFITGYTFGVIIMLIVVSIADDFSKEGKIMYSLIMGIFVAIMWVFLWWKFGVPVVAVQPTLLLAGFVAASILFYTQLGLRFGGTTIVPFKRRNYGLEV